MRLRPAAREPGEVRAVPRRRVRIGPLWIDVLTRDEALDGIAALVEAGRGGSVFTPNVDHIVQAEDNEPFRRAYERASLAFVDGTPVLWAARLLGTPFPEKLSGSDLVLPIARRAAAARWRVYLLGGDPGVGEKAAARLREEHGVNVVGVDAPMIRAEGGGEGERAVVERIRETRPHLVFVALGAPKQELWIARVLDDIRPAVAIAVGASLDFVAGTARRAPTWMSRAGLEWLYRLSQEPRRLWHRYLVRDPRFVVTVLRTLLIPRELRVRPRAAADGTAPEGREDG